VLVASCGQHHLDQGSERVDYDNISVAYEDSLAIITFARESALNAINSDVLAEMTTAVAEIELQDDILVVALTGAGDKAFVAGADILEMKAMDPIEAHAFGERGANLAQSIETSPKPYIAAVNGFALGGGCEISLACDFIYAAEGARLGQPEVKLGIIPGFGGTQRLPRRVGVAKAKELILTGDMIDAAEALRIGLVDAVFPAAELMPAVRAVAARIAANGPLAVAAAKQLIHVGQSMSLESAILLEVSSFAGLFNTEDQDEGMDAFANKRKAEFKGR
jgi:enoyl-CoA hydratase